jgi:hypothetical protein
MSCRVLDCFVDLETNANNRSRSSSRFNPEDMRSQTCQITPAHAAEDFYLDYFGGTSAYCIARRFCVLGGAYCIPYAIKRFDKLFKLQEGVTAEIASSSPAAVTKPPLSITLESYLNLLRLGTPFKRTGDSIEITEQEQNNEPNESARTASPVTTSIVQDQLLERADVDSEGCNYNFFPVDEKTYLVPPELPLMPVQKNALRITTRSSPALISLFVALGVAPDPKSTATDGDYERLIPAYFCQPQVNNRVLGVDRLSTKDDRGFTMMDTAKGMGTKKLFSHDIVVMIYSVRVLGSAKWKLKRKSTDIRCSRLHPMAPVRASQDSVLQDDPFATSVRLKDVTSLWEILFDNQYADNIKLEETVDEREEVMVCFNLLMNRLQRKYHGLSSRQDWINLWFLLRRKTWKSTDGNIIDCPRSRSALCHDVRVMLLALTPIRVGLLDGLGRVGATLYSLLGREPEVTLNMVEERLDEGRCFGTNDIILKSTGATVSLQVVDCEKDWGGTYISKATLERYVNYSLIIQEAYGGTTHRSLLDCLVVVGQKLISKHTSDSETPVDEQDFLRPGEFKWPQGRTGGEGTPAKDYKDLNTNWEWATKIRKTTIELIRENCTNLKYLHKDLITPILAMEDLDKWLADDKRFKADTVFTKYVFSNPGKLMCLLTLFSQFLYISGDTADEDRINSTGTLTDFLRFNGKGRHAGGHWLPPSPQGSEMNGFFPTFKDAVDMDSPYDVVFSWLIHRPQSYLAGACYKKIRRGRGSLKPQVARYTMPAGTSILRLYNNLGPIMDMSESLRKTIPALWRIMNVNPYASPGDEADFQWECSGHTSSTYAAHWYKPATAALWSNIPTFVSLLVWMGVRSSALTEEGVPDEEKLFYIFRHPKHLYFDSTGNLNKKEYEDPDDRVGRPTHEDGTPWTELRSWTDLEPKFVWRLQAFNADEDKETFKDDEDDPSRPLTLIEMADLFLNENTRLWEVVLGHEPSPQELAEKRGIINHICSLYNWESHFYGAYGPTTSRINSYSEMKIEKNTKKNKLDGGFDSAYEMFLTGSATVKGSDEKTRTLRKKPPSVPTVTAVAALPGQLSAETPANENGVPAAGGPSAETPANETAVPAAGGPVATAPVATQVVQFEQLPQGGSASNLGTGVNKTTVTTTTTRVTTLTGPPAVPPLAASVGRGSSGHNGPAGSVGEGDNEDNNMDDEVDVDDDDDDNDEDDAATGNVGGNDNLAPNAVDAYNNYCAGLLTRTQRVGDPEWALMTTTCKDEPASLAYCFGAMQLAFLEKAMRMALMQELTGRWTEQMNLELEDLVKKKEGPGTYTGLNGDQWLTQYRKRKQAALKSFNEWGKTDDSNPAMGEALFNTQQKNGAILATEYATNLEDLMAKNAAEEDKKRPKAKKKRAKLSETKKFRECMGLAGSLPSNMTAKEKHTARTHAASTYNERLASRWHDKVELPIDSRLIARLNAQDNDDGNDDGNDEDNDDDNYDGNDGNGGDGNGGDGNGGDGNSGDSSGDDDDDDKGDGAGAVNSPRDKRHEHLTETRKNTRSGYSGKEKAMIAALALKAKTKMPSHAPMRLMRSPEPETTDDEEEEEDVAAENGVHDDGDIALGGPRAARVAAIWPRRDIADSDSDNTPVIILNLIPEENEASRGNRPDDVENEEQPKKKRRKRN